MTILHRELQNTGAFYIEENGKNLGQMVYRRNSPNHITITHTEVDEALKGKGAGKQMLSKAVNWARENKVRITPVCEFAKALFEKIPDFGDVLDR